MSKAVVDDAVKVLGRGWGSAAAPERTAATSEG